MALKHKRRRYPPHPAVDWTTEHVGPDNEQLVAVTCEICQQVRWYRSTYIAHAIKNAANPKAKQFTGRCMKDRWVGLNRLRVPYPDHPAIDYTKTNMVTTRSGNRLLCVEVTCDVCGAKRWKNPGTIRCLLRTTGWSPRCRPCARLLLDHPSGGRMISPNGYLYVSKKACTLDQIKYFDAMTDKRNSKVAHHRLVVATVLGRPLTKEEVVHHKDGDRLNNSPENLELFIRAKHHPGHGEFYYELQLAKAEIARLKEQLAANH